MYIKLSFSTKKEGFLLVFVEILNISTMSRKEVIYGINWQSIYQRSI